MTVAVVTGASQGIGQATAIALARGGADVVGTHRPNADAAEQGVRRARRSRPSRRSAGGAGSSQADAADPASAELVAGIALDELGGLDIWVNNAARLLVRPFLETSDDDWASIMGSNVMGYVYGCRAAIAPHARIRAVAGSSTSRRSPACSRSPTSPPTARRRAR